MMRDAHAHRVKGRSARLALQPADLNGGRLFHRAVPLTARQGEIFDVTPAQAGAGSRKSERAPTGGHKGLHILGS
jgi:hypothetical protein